MPKPQTVTRLDLEAESFPIPKLFIPPVRAKRVVRSRLLKKLDALWQGEQRVGLVTAPAGFGKTTLVSEWVATGNTDCAWLSLDESDDDPARFLRCLIAAIKTLDPSVGQDLQPALQSTPCPVTPILGALINEIALALDDFVLVFDDSHVLTRPEIYQALDYLVEHMPLQMRLVFVSRNEPPLALARWRGQNRLIELNVDELRFARPEAAEFFDHVCGIALPDDTLKMIDRHLEGWAAGLQLTALALQNQASSLLAGFERARRYIFDYLAGEVLNRQTAMMRQFLLETSILDRFNAELCDAVTGRGDGRACLTAMEQANLFVIPLDEQRQWYRYHSLFAELLRAELHRELPQSIDRLYNRAARWLEQHGQAEQAIEYYLATRETERAAILIERLSPALFLRGETGKLRRWFDRLPDKLIGGNLRLCLTRAWLAVQSERAGILQVWIDRADELLTEVGERATPMRGELLALHARALASTHPGSTEAIELCERALASRPTTDEWVRASTLALYGSLLWQNGQLEAAVWPYEEALAMSRADGNWWTFILAAAEISLLQVACARFANAGRLCREALALVESHFLSPDDWPPVAGHLVRSLSYLEYEQGHLTEAVQLAGQVVRAGQQHSDVELQVVGMTVQIRVAYASGRVEEALHLAENAATLARQSGNAAVVSNADTYRAWMLLATGDIAAAERWANHFRQSGQYPDGPASHVNYPEFETLTLIRVLLAKAEVAEALTWLDSRIEIAKASGRQRMLIKTLIVRAIAFKMQNDEEQALSDMAQALILAKPNGFVQLFLDEGELARQLLVACAAWPNAHAVLPGDPERSASVYAKRLLAAYSQAPEVVGVPADYTAGLSQREQEVLDLIANGLSNAEIANNLSISLNTVYTHTKNIFRKLGARSRTQAVALARQRHLL